MFSERVFQMLKFRILTQFKKLCIYEFLNVRKAYFPLCFGSRHNGTHAPFNRRRTHLPHIRIHRVKIDVDELISLVIGSLNDTKRGDSPNCSGNIINILVWTKYRTKSPGRSSITTLNDSDVCLEPINTRRSSSCRLLASKAKSFQSLNSSYS